MPHGKAFEGRGCEGKGHGFYPRLSSEKAGVFCFSQGRSGCVTGESKESPNHERRSERLLNMRAYFKISEKECTGRDRKVMLRLLIAVFISLFLTLHFLPLPSSFAQAPRRIVSLAPSTTEILFAAGLGDNIVGVTLFCDYPAAAKSKPKIGGMSNPSLEGVVSMRPDIVIMTTDGNPREFEQKLHALNIRTYVFDSLTLPELPDGIRKMGVVLDEKKRFDTLALDIERRMKGLKKDRAGEGKKVLFIIWPEPLIVAGPKTAVDDAINLLGAVNIAGNAIGRYPKYSLEEIFRQSPDFIFIGKGKGMEDVSSGLLKKLAAVRAVRNGKVFYVGDSLFRLGPRTVDGVEELAEYIK